jgi:hypothetical protein
MNCPNCGADLSEAKRLVRTSAKELVEGLRFEQFIEWCNLNMPTSIDTMAEFEAFRDRMRANGYRTNAGPVKDAAAAFRTHLRNVVKWRSRAGKAKPRATERKEL